MNSQQSPKGKPRGLKGGRKKLGEERGGLVRISVQLFADQAERLAQEGQGQGWLIRAAVDLLIGQLDKAAKKNKRRVSGRENAMNESININNRLSEQQPCGCVRFPSFTEGHFVDNFGEGPRVWQSGTHYEAWTDTSACQEGHDEG